MKTVSINFSLVLTWRFVGKLSLRSVNTCAFGGIPLLFVFLGQFESLVKHFDFHLQLVALLITRQDLHHYNDGHNSLLWFLLYYILLVIKSQELAKGDYNFYFRIHILFLVHFLFY